jgi:hypothetical protein
MNSTLTLDRSRPGKIRENPSGDPRISLGNCPEADSACLSRMPDARGAVIVSTGYLPRTPDDVPREVFYSCGMTIGV